MYRCTANNYKLDINYVEINIKKIAIYVKFEFEKGSRDCNKK